ncbi:MAG: hypothetical protein IJ532_02225 [Alphaproteobacteria bacterium]|nr:hypothetical protein [Alphaproteobacteria bacterium]
MAQNVTLKIFTPEKTALERKVYRVVLPYGNINLTVLEDRAPTSLVLHAGMLQILREDDSVEDIYFIDRGVADIADNVCQISTAHLIRYDKISVDEAKELAQQEPQNAEFYTMILETVEGLADIIGTMVKPL